MANQQTVLGRIPTYAGPWDSNYVNPKTGHNGYPLKKRVTLYGSEFQSKMEDNTYAPATLNAAGTQITFDTTHWEIISNGTDAYLFSNQATATMTAIQSELSTLEAGAAAGATAYQKPSGGIPSTDLASSVQTSLGLADTALQSHQSKADLGLDNVTNDAQVKRTEMGVANGVATLDENGLVPVEQLPSYIDDVVDLLAITDTAPATCAKGDLYFNTTTSKIVRATAANTWGTGSTTNTDPEKGKIYVNLTNDKSYRWSGSVMVEISSSDVTGIKVGSSGSTITPSQGVITLPEYETGADVTDAENVKAALNVVTTSQGKFLKDDGTWAKPEGGASYVPTLQSAPTSSTLTYTKDGKTIAFEIGQLCRIADNTADSGYTFYMLKDLVTENETTTAVWENVSLDNVAYIASGTTASIPSFDPYSQSVHITAQILSSAQQAQVQENIGIGTMGASGTNHKSGLVPDPGAVQGTTKFLREDGTWAETEGGSYTPTLLTAPTSSTITYTKDGKIIEFKIGDEARVYDEGTATEGAHGYVYYKLYDLVTEDNVTTAYWGISGSGDTRSAIYVNLTAEINDLSASSSILNGVTVSLYNITDSVDVETRTWQGAQIVFRGLTALKDYRITVGNLNGFTIPDPQTVLNLPIAEGVDAGEFLYLSDEYTVTIDSDQTDKTDIANAKVIVDGVEYANGIHFRVPKDTSFTSVTATNISGYKNQLGVLGRIITSTYIMSQWLTGYITIDQTTSDPTQMILDESGNGYDNFKRPAVIDVIRGMSHRYVGTFENNVMYLKQLHDQDSTKYADGTDASTDIKDTGKDVWMRLPDFYTKATEIETDKWKIEFAIDVTQPTPVTSPGSGWTLWSGNSNLIGVYKGYKPTGSTYLNSISGNPPITGTVPATLKTYASNRGTGFSLIKWRQHNIMAILFYAYYGHTNSQLICGDGGSGTGKVSGKTNSFGMEDTTKLNGDNDGMNFWGLENWWCDKAEFLQNVSVTGSTWTITEDDGTTRTIGYSPVDSAHYTIYPAKMRLGSNLDMLPKDSTTATSSTGYCDTVYTSLTSSPFLVVRCGSSATVGSGIAYLYTSGSNSTTYSSRLAFGGTIEMV